jgi:hypothetical protein
MGALASLVTQVTYSTDTSSSSGGSAAFTGVMIFVYIAVAIISIVAMWKVFTKAGQPGWAVLIPILNTLVVLRLIKRPWWWLLLMLIPCVGFVIAIIVLWDLAKAFGKGAGMFVLLLLLHPIGLLVLGFGSAEYQLEPDPIF